MTLTFLYNLLTFLKNLCIIKIENESHRKCGYHYKSFNNTFLPTKAECVVFLLFISPHYVYATQ